MDNPIKAYTTTKCACSPKDYYDRATKQKEKGSMGQDLGHPNMQLLDGVVCINGRRPNLPITKEYQVYTEGVQ